MSSGLPVQGVGRCSLIKPQSVPWESPSIVFHSFWFLSFLLTFWPLLKKALEKMPLGNFLSFLPLCRKMGPRELFTSWIVSVPFTSGCCLCQFNYPKWCLGFLCIWFLSSSGAKNHIHSSFQDMPLSLDLTAGLLDVAKQHS